VGVQVLVRRNIQSGLLLGPSKTPHTMLPARYDIQFVARFKNLVLTGIKILKKCEFHIKTYNCPKIVIENILVNMNKW